MAPKDKQPLPANADADAKDGERIAKVLSRRGIASRREAERLIEAGEVTVNGKVITSPALNVTDRDRITISGQALPEREEARVWLYYKPEGLVTSTADEKGRDTVFDHLPEDMPRVMTVGRLDLNSEGLLLLTNDGELKRRLELPSTGWLRKYRVRVNGDVDDVRLQPLRDGITIDGEHFKPMQVMLDRIQGANAWLTVGLREGRNREIRRAMNAIGLYVNRLLRISYGPFRLGDLQPGEVEEVKPRVLRDQLGEIAEAAEASPAPRGGKPGAARGGKPGFGAKPGASAKPSLRPRSRSEREDAQQSRGFSPRKSEGRGNEGYSSAPAPRGKSSALDYAKPDGSRLARPVKAGDGTKALSRSWKAATSPASEAPAGGKRFGSRTTSEQPSQSRFAPRGERFERAERPERTERPARFERPERPERNERNERPMATKGYSPRQDEGGEAKAKPGRNSFTHAKAAASSRGTAGKAPYGSKPGFKTNEARGEKPAGPRKFGTSFAANRGAERDEAPKGKPRSPARPSGKPSGKPARPPRSRS